MSEVEIPTQEDNLCGQVELIRLMLLGCLVEKSGQVWHLTTEINGWDWTITCKCVQGLDSVISVPDRSWNQSELDNSVDRINGIADFVLHLYRYREKRHFENV